MQPEFVVRHGRVGALLLAGAGLAAVAALSANGPVAPAGAQATTVRDVTVTLQCKLTVGEPIARCRGTWTMSGEIRDKGNLTKSESTDRDGSGGLLKTTLDGKKGTVLATDSGLRVSHRRRGCTYTTSWSLRGETGGFTGFRGATAAPICSKVTISGSTISRSDRFKIRLEKRG